MKLITKNKKWIVFNYNMLPGKHHPATCHYIYNNNYIMVSGDHIGDYIAWNAITRKTRIGIAYKLIKSLIKFTEQDYKTKIIYVDSRFLKLMSESEIIL